jgi:rhodanese-related sulfurtransferase
MRALWTLVIVVAVLVLWDVGWWYGFGVSPMSPWALKMAVNEDRAPVIIDVRTPGEYAAFHIPGAVNVPYPATLAELAAASPDPTRQVVVVCMTGHRSPPVVRQMHAGGYTNVSNLTWGMMAWKIMGGETTSGP